MEMSAHASLLHAALGYCARRLLTELERMPGAQSASPLAQRLTPTTASLLRWWCSTESCNTRVDNFHPGQRQAIVHTVIAHELLGSDDPERLYRLACEPARAMAEAPMVAPSVPHAHYQLRMAPGSGLRWVAQALLLWQWANDADARVSGRSDPRFSGKFVLLTANAAVRERMQDALFGPLDDGGRRDVSQSSLIRHTRLFLPLPLRASFLDWLEIQAWPANGGGKVRIDLAVDNSETLPPITLLTGIDARAPGHSEVVHARGDHASPQCRARLRVDLSLSQASVESATDSTPLAEYTLDHAIRDGAAKLPMLEPTQSLRLPALRQRSPRRMGLRPRLSRAHSGLLKIGLEALSRRDAGFVALDPVRRPQLLVLCDTPQLIRGVRRGLIECGMDKAEIAIRTKIDTLPACTMTMDARICVIVVLRTLAIAQAPAVVLAPALPPLWPEADFAALRGENRERAALGRMPHNLLDVLSVVEHPQCHAEHADLLRAGHAVQGRKDHNADAAGDLLVARLRADADAFDIAYPCLCDDGVSTCGDERLSDLSSRILRARQSMPVRKSVYTHEAWSAYDSGLRRAIVECAEHDPGIESHCMLDPRRHGIQSRDRLLLQGIPPRSLPDAMLRTAEAVYLVEFQPFCPAQPPPPSPGERAMARWCIRANARPAAQRRHRFWYHVQLQAPLFWSWKRSGGALSALLVTLAGAAPPAHRSLVVQVSTER